MTIGSTTKRRDHGPRRWVAPALLLALVAAVATCAYNPPPVPVSGDPETLGFLAGEWSGTYASEDAQRRGSVFFRLRAGADTARGEVLMTRHHDLYAEEELRAPTELEMPQAVAAPPVVTIEFVRAAGEWVYGSLDSYRDPECGCQLQTSFTGRVVDGQLEGTFVITFLDSGRRLRGSWSARRTGPPPRGPEPAREAAAETPRDPGVPGPNAEAMIAQGRALFADLGCSFCHRPREGARMAPDLAETLPHRSFSWIYRMILNPDSMVRNDPVAKGVYEQYGLEMPERGATPWEALVLYEYLLAEVMEASPPDDR